MCGGPKIDKPLTPAAVVKLEDISTELALRLKAPKALKDTLLNTGSDAGSIFFKNLVEKT